MRKEAPALPSIVFRKAQAKDGAGIWNVVAESGKLDVNSPYCYLMLGEYFADTCFVAEVNREIIGFVTSYLLPGKPDTLFVWQIAAAAAYRGRGVATGLLQMLLSSTCCEDVQYIETHISPSNAASGRLFAKLAEYLEAPLAESEGFSARLFPGGAHEDENLIQIGPIRERNKSGSTGGDYHAIIRSK